MDDEPDILGLTIRTELALPANTRSDLLASSGKMRARKIPFSPSSPWAEAQMKPQQQRNIK